MNYSIIKQLFVGLFLLFATCSRAQSFEFIIERDTAWRELIQEQDPTKLETLVAKCPYITTTDSLGSTYLHNAAHYNNLNLVKLLIQYGANVHVKNQAGETAVHKAAYGSSVEIIKLLIQHGADMHDKGGRTPLHIAARYNNLDIVKFLIEQGVDINAQDTAGWTPLHMAAEAGSIEVAKLLIKKGADINARTISQNITPIHDNCYPPSMHEAEQTPLHYAAFNKKFDMVRILVKHGADIFAKTTSGETAADIARYYKQKDIANYLEAGCLGRRYIICKRGLTPQKKQEIITFIVNLLIGNSASLSF